MVFEKLLPIVLLFFIGYGLKQIGVLKEEDSGFLGRVLVNLVIPVLFMQILWNTELDFSLILFPLTAVILLTVLLAVGFALARLFGLKGKVRGSFITSMATLEGSIGYVLMFAAFGEFGLSRIILLDVGNVFFLFGVVYPLTHLFGNEGVKVKDSLIKILKTPMVWGVVTGILLNAINFDNALIQNLAENVAGSAILLIILLLGVEFKPRLSSLKLPIATTILKSIIGMVLGMTAAYLLGLQGVERTAIIVWAALPPSFLNIVFAKENNLDLRFTSNLLTVAIPFGIIFLASVIGVI